MTTYYAKTDGDNAKDGLSPDNAWETISYALTQMIAYDVLNISEGAYPETVRASTEHITLVGAGSELVTISKLILDASFTDCSGMTATASESISPGREITNTTLTDVVGTQYVWFGFADNMVATNCDFTKCLFSYKANNASFSNTTFRTNDDYCLHVSIVGSNLTFENTTIMGVPPSEGGICIRRNADNHIFTNTTFEYPENAIIIVAGSTATFIQENNKVFVGTTGTNTITPTESTLLATEGTYEYRDFTITPDAEITLVETSLWETTGNQNKQWKIAATGLRNITFQLGDMLPDTLYDIYVGIEQISSETSNSSGVLTFSYTGTFSEKEFHVERRVPTKRYMVHKSP